MSNNTTLIEPANETTPLAGNVTEMEGAEYLSYMHGELSTSFSQAVAGNPWDAVQTYVAGIGRVMSTMFGAQGNAAQFFGVLFGLVLPSAFAIMIYYNGSASTTTVLKRFGLNLTIFASLAILTAYIAAQAI